MFLKISFILSKNYYHFLAFFFLKIKKLFFFLPHFLKPSKQSLRTCVSRRLVNGQQ